MYQFSQTDAEVKAWVSNYTLQFHVYVITYFPIFQT